MLKVEEKADSAIHTSDSSHEELGNGLDRNGVPRLASTTKRYKINFDQDQDFRITLAWKELSVYVPKKKLGFQGKQERNRHFKRVLNNVTGIICPGSLTAVMGASGAGKTTLMNVLAHKAKGDVEIGGDILVNGKPVGPFIGDISGFVYQEDLFIGTLTVAEHLHFMASIKLDRRLSSSEKKRRVEELLVSLSLKKCENTRIGVPGGQSSGISGGERKRLSFATEILTNPSILFCDEPTTGLDSFSAKKIVGMLKSMASEGKTIICTIHQPSSQIFSMFDQFCLLAEGRTAFMGSSDGALNFMSGMNYHCPPHYNLGDFYVRTLSVLPGKEFESKRTVKSICDAFAKSKEAEEIDDKILNELKSYSDTFKNGACSTDILTRQNRRPNWFCLTGWLIWRAVVNSSRNPKIQAIKFLQKIVLAIIIGLCYYAIPRNQEGIQNIQGVIFILITESTFPSLYGTLHVFHTEFPLFLREEKAGLYRVSSYYLAKIFSLVPVLIVEGLIFSTVTYWLVGLEPNVQDFLLTSLVVVLTVNIAGACGCFFSAAFDSVGMAVTCLVPVDYILMVSGGQFMNLGHESHGRKTIPIYIAWAQYLSWFMYSNEAISIIQWRHITNITCDTKLDVPCINTGQEVLKSRSFDEVHLWFDIIGLLTLFTLFHVGGYVSLIMKSRKK